MLKSFFIVDYNCHKERGEVKMKNNFIGLYEKAMPSSLTIYKKLLLAKECGFNYMEISIDETDEKLSRIFSKKQTLEIKSACSRAEFPILTMCLSGHRKYPLGEDNPKSMQIMIAAIDFAVELGIRIIQLAGYDTYYNQSTVKTQKRFAENLQTAVDYAAQKGVILAFETMETEFMNTCAKAMKYVKTVCSPYLQIYPDIGNIRNATDNYLDDLQCAKGHIVAAHLKETVEGRYRDMEYGEGRVDFKGCIQKLQENGVHLFTCEFWYDGNTEPQAYILRNRQYINQFFKE